MNTRSTKKKWSSGGWHNRIPIPVGVMLLLYAFAGCGEDPGISGGQNELPQPPRQVHWVAADAETVRLVWSRSEDDFTDGSKVRGYLVCPITDECAEVDRNYFDLPAAYIDTDGSLPVLVYAVGTDEQLSAAVFADIGSGPVLVPPPGTSFASDNEIGKADGPAPASYAVPPTLVYSPVYGAVKVIGPGTSNITDSEWGFWRHEHCDMVDGWHCDFTKYNDTLAYDINLNVTGTGGNLDKGMEFLPVGYGWVKKWLGTTAPGGDSLKTIYVDHSGWSSVYLHASVVNAKENDYVTPWTILGKIGGSGGYPDHLHVSVYKKVGTKLVSYSVSFLSNPVTIAWTQSLTQLKKGTATTLGATATRKHHVMGHVGGTGGYVPPSVNLNTAAVFANTWWKSSNSSVLSVDGNGKVTAKAAGTATISLYYSGQLVKRTLTVVL